jgi:hypothetical protein
VSITKLFQIFQSTSNNFLGFFFRAPKYFSWLGIIFELKKIKKEKEKSNFLTDPAHQPNLTHPPLFPSLLHCHAGLTSQDSSSALGCIHINLAYQNLLLNNFAWGCVLLHFSLHFLKLENFLEILPVFTVLQNSLKFSLLYSQKSYKTLGDFRKIPIFFWLQILLEPNPKALVNSEKSIP